MKRPTVANSSQIPDASVKASCIRMEPVAPCSHNMKPMPEMSKDKSEEVSSLETVLKIFWNNQKDQLENFTGFNRQNHLPLSRVKKILKSNPEVKKISWDAPALFSKACEYFILELTLRAWMHTQSCTHQTIRRCDVLQAVKKSEIYEFLIDLVPFGPHCITHQGVPEHSEPEEVLPAAEMIVPDINVPIDMNQIEENQENLMAERFINNKGFDLNSDLQILQ